MSNVNILANLVSKNLLTPNNTDNRLGIVTATPGSTLSVAGTVTADKFLTSDGAEVGGAGGIGTAMSAQGPGKDIFYVDKTLGINETITIDIPNSSTVAYTLNQEIVTTENADIIIADGDDFLLDVLGLSTEGTTSGLLSGAGGRVRTGQITGPNGGDAPIFPSGLVVTGVSTFTAVNATTGSFSGDVTATTGSFSGNVSVGGTLTYEDVTNVDSVGLVTARTGIDVTGGNIDLVDNSMIRVGTNDDLQIYHNGSHNIFQSSNGNISFQVPAGGEIQLAQGGSFEHGARFIAGGAVELYHDNSKKIETSATGVTVTGTVTDTSGDLRITPISAKSGNYTLVATDTGKTITRTGGNITVPQSMTAGMVVTIINNVNSTMDIIKGTGVTLRSTDGTDATKTLAAYGVATVLYISASSAYLTGSGLS